MASYEYEWTFDELIKLIFFKKVCPNCNNKLKKNLKSEFIRIGWHNSGTDYIYGKQYKKEIRYYCESCDKIIQVKELKRIVKD